MSVRENVAAMIQWYRVEHGLSLAELAEELGIARSSLQCYLKGKYDLRVDTIELLADRMNCSFMEMISGPVPEWERAAAIVRAARELGDLSEEERERGALLFLELIDLFSGRSQSLAKLE